MLTVKTLRYYDEIGLLSPVAIDPESGYRLYNQSSYDRAMIIQLLRRYDFTIQEMLEVVPAIEGPEDIAAYLLEKHTHWQREVELIKSKQTALVREVAKLKEDVIMKSTEVIQIKEVEAITIASLRYLGRYDELGTYLGKLFKAIGMNAAGTPFALYHDGEYKEEGADIEVAVPVKKPVNHDGVTTRTLEGGKHACLVHVGPYSTLHQSYKQLADYLATQGLVGATPSREHYLKGPGMLLKGNEEKYRTEIQIPLKQS